MSEQQINRVMGFLKGWQQSFCSMLEQHADSSAFSLDSWSHSTGGGGVSCVMQGDEVFESAAVNFSHVKGHEMPATASLTRPHLKGCPFQATGVSIIVHPKNPYVPTSHGNLRYFEAQTEQGPVWWFGGGFDLTPYYGFIDDCEYWHQQAKDACDEYGEQWYPLYKKQCDDYFYLRHRQEWRGIGGLFFDDMNQLGFDEGLRFLSSIGRAYQSTYETIVKRRQSMEYGERERAFQCYRRGRYVEFNLLYDRGTLFGLQSGGRTESILLSMPPTVNWQYQYKPVEGSPECRLNMDFLTPREWV